MRLRIRCGGRHVATAGTSGNFCCQTRRCSISSGRFASQRQLKLFPNFALGAARQLRASLNQLHPNRTERQETSPPHEGVWGIVWGSMKSARGLRGGVENPMAHVLRPFVGERRPPVAQWGRRERVTQHQHVRASAEGIRVHLPRLQVQHRPFCWRLQPPRHSTSSVEQIHSSFICAQ